jgi:predicted NUDIX family NTP pyrophosphohydrolase
MFRRNNGQLEVLLGHPGGPFWKGKDAGAWTIPKGEVNEGEEPLLAAQREFREETGFTPQGPFLPLGQVRQKSGKIVHAWAFEGDCDPACLRSNSFKVEWPPRSGRFVDAPELDRIAFFSIEQAKGKMLPAQATLLEELQRQVP